MAAPAAPAGGMPAPLGGDSPATTPTGTARSGGGDADADGREQHSSDADGQAPAEPDRRAVASRLLMLLDDVDLPVLVLGDDRPVEVVRGLHLAVHLLDRLVVGDSRVDVVVRPHDHEQRVVLLLGHGPLPGSISSDAVTVIPGRPAGVTRRE